MSDISTKLTYLNTTKGKIKDVINMTGANITSDTTFRNYATKLYDGYISVLKDKNTLLDNMPKGTSTGTITDAADLPVYEDKMSKESTQETTTGKNLLKNNGASSSGTAVVFKKNQDGSISVSGKANAGVEYLYTILYVNTSNTELSPNTTYYLSDGLSNEHVYLQIYQMINGSWSFINSTQRSRQISFSFSPEAIQLWIRVRVASQSSYQIEDEVILYPMIRLSTIDDDSYEPYTNGPAPNPDYSSEVKTVKGYRNLFDKANYTSGKWIGQSGSISNDSNFGYSDYIEIKSSTSYFLSGLANGGGTHPGFCFYDTTYTYISGEENNGRTSILITTPLNAKYIRFSFKKVDLDTIQLVEGTEELPYVPYGTNWIYKKITGKNLFNGIYYQTYTAGGSPYSYKSSSVTRSAVIEVEPNKTYSISKELTDRFRISEYSEYPVVDISNALNYIYPNNNDSTLNYTLTTTNQTHYLVIQISNSSQENAKLQVELNNQVTTYESYKESIITIPLNNNEIAGIGDYKDELIVDKNGKCWLNKKTGKVVLDGSENWEIGSSGFFLHPNTGIFTNRKTTSYLGFCNNFIFNKNSTTWTNKNYCGFSSTNVFWVRDDGEIATTIADWKNWLTTHNTEVYYPLASSQLIDLNYTVDLTLFEGVNNISNSEDMDMEIKYIKESYE